MSRENCNADQTLVQLYVGRGFGILRSPRALGLFKVMAYRSIGFDGWTVRVDTGELTRNGHTVRLQEQSLRILLELVARPGELITREQLIACLWPKGIVDFDAGLNAAIRKLRIALQDDSVSPRYIETVPRKGYRFIGTLSPVRLGAPPQSAEVTDPTSTRVTSPSAPPPQKSPRERLRIYAYLLTGAVAVIVATFAIDARREKPGPQARLAAPASAPAFNTIAILQLQALKTDERSTSLADALTFALRERLSGLRGLIVTPGISSDAVRGTDVISIGQQLRTRYVVRGRLSQSVDRLQLDVALFDAPSGAKLWSKSFAQPVAGITAIDQIVGDIAGELKIEERAIRADPHPVELQAYEICARAERLLSSQRFDDAEEAARLFARATELDPQLARAYAGMAEAILLSNGIAGRGRSPEIVARAEKALARALDLDATLGEAWIQRARLQRNDGEAEAHYRRGIELAPGYGPGYAYFAKFLADRERRGEAMEVTERGRQLDPLSMPLYQTKAVMLIYSRNDVAGHDALLREALTINPDHPQVLASLASSRYIWSGEIAEGLQLAERLFAVQPQVDAARQLVVAMYLDVGDIDAAAALVRGSHSSTVSQMELAQYRRDTHRAVALANDLPIAPRDSVSPVAEAIRDGAMLHREYGPAIKRLESAYRGWNRAPITNRSTALVYAHALLLSGEEERGRQVAASILALLDAEGAGRPKGWFSRERAAAFALLGRTIERSMSLSSARN